MSEQRNSEKTPLAFPPLVVWLLGIGKRPRAFPPLVILLLGLLGLVVLTVVVAHRNPSLKFLVWWSFWLFFGAVTAGVLVQTWLLHLYPVDCPKCGGKMHVPLSEMFRGWGASYPSIQIRFTCRTCGHVADSGIWFSTGTRGT